MKRNDMETRVQMIVDVVQLMHKACEETGVDYEEFVLALDDAFDARYEIVEV